MVPLNTLNIGEQGEIIKIEKNSCRSHNKMTPNNKCECFDEQNGLSEQPGRTQTEENKKALLEFELKKQKYQFLCRLEELGLRVGKKVKIIQKGKRGPILVKVDETRIALEQGMASKILIQHQ